MTRDAEHTPSPQSVVVPVAVLNEAAGVLDCEGYGPLSMSLLSCLSAPAPSSLAGGEVTDEWADRFCEAVNWSPDGQECKTVEGELRCTTFRQIAKGHILSAIATNPYPDNAALSPEAPAREGEWREGMRVKLASGGSGTIANIRYGVAMDLEDGSPDLGWAPQNFLDTDASDFVEALTPRHEAPAPSAGEVAKAAAVFQSAIDDFEAEVAEVMAEGSERADLWDREITVNIDALKVVMSAALRARSSAPEAREGEAWRYRLDGSKAWNFTDDPHAANGYAADGRWIVRRMFDCPAAPSADKLRIAVEAMRELIDADKELAIAVNFCEPTKNEEAITSAEYRTQAARSRAEEAIAALKAEGAK